MPIESILEKRIQYRIKKSKDFVFMLPDFEDLSDKDQIMRALRKLIEKGLILKVGQGVYVKAEKSAISGMLLPQIDVAEIARIVAKKLKVKTIPSKYELWYNEGKTTQVPTGRVVAVLGRINRKIGFNGKFIKYETVRNREKYYRFN
jgi:hypothetical protein